MSNVPDLSKWLPNPNRKLRDCTYSQFNTDIPFGCRLKDGIKYVKKRSISLYRQFFSKIYNNTDRFEDWRWAHYAQARHLLAAIDDNANLNYDAARNAVRFTGAWIGSGLNTFFVEPHLFDAVQNTAPPIEVEFRSFKMPHQALMFILPKGKLSFRNEAVSYLGVSYHPKGIQIYKGLDNLAIEDEEAQESFLVTTSIQGNAFFFGVRMTEEGLKLVTKDSGEDFNNYIQRHHGNQNEADDVQFVVNAFRIALNLILAMEVSPKIVERGHRMHSIRRDRERSVWSPNVIGAKYRIQYTDESTGSHASPRCHWRRGHFRRQGFGKTKHICLNCEHEASVCRDDVCMNATCNCEKSVYGYRYADYRTIWIEPVLVNSGK